MRYAMILAATLSLLPARLLAHCDGMDGPVVKAAQAALEKSDVNRVLIWVQPDDEAQIRQAFMETMAVRKQGPQARDLADRYFFETLVRIHRAGEGAPYTGLKPAGRNLGPAIPSADQAIERGSVDALRTLLTKIQADGIERHFREVMAKKDYEPTDVQAGREFVSAYVDFIHYAEGLYRAAAGLGSSHDEEGQGSAAHHVE